MNLSDTTLTLLKERLAILPEEISTLINSNKVDDTVTLIKNVFELSEEQANAISNEIVLTILAFSPLNKLEDNLSKIIVGDKTKLTDIYTIIYNNIFSPFLELYETIESKSKEAPKELELGTETKESTNKPEINNKVAEGVNEVNSSINKEDKTTSEVSSQIRTMAADMNQAKNNEPVHSSNQDDLLRS